MKDFTGGTQLVIKSSNNRNTIYAIGYKYNLSKITNFISTPGTG